MNKEEWNRFVASSPHGSFLQSWEWGQMQEELGVKIWRLEEAQVAALVLRRELPLGKSWLYVPRGPVITPPSPSPHLKGGNLPLKRGGETEGVWQGLEKQLTALAEQENSIFIRIDPATSLPPGGKWKKAEREVQPRNTLILDLAKGEEELLAGMHQKTRYNIRLSQKKGVRVRFSRDGSDVEHFLKLSKDVSERTTFLYHPDEYYKAMLGLDFTELALAEYEGEVLAAHFTISLGDTVTYVHGASSSGSREVMAPHLLQWETIKRAKEKGFKKYDFFGVAPDGADQDHPWSGVTRFKLGFGGRRVDYIGAHDLVLHEAMYHLFNTARHIKTLLR